MAAKTEKDWQAEMDARTLADAAAINSDPGRKKAAGTAAKRLVSEEQKRAKAQQAQAAAMQKLASGKGTQPAKAKAPARKSSPTKRAASKSSGKRRR